MAAYGDRILKDACACHLVHDYFPIPFDKIPVINTNALNLFTLSLRAIPL